MNAEWLIWLASNIEILLGCVMLLVACLLLPAGLRWKVLTVGVLLIAVQIWQKQRSRQRLAELDNQRAGLQQRLQQLDNEVNKLREENQVLQQRRQILEAQRISLESEIAGLRQGDDALHERGQSLLQQYQQLQQQEAQLADQGQTVEKALQRWQQWRDGSERSLQAGQ